MKQIALRHFTIKPDGYEVYLGNSSFHKFKNKKAAINFLADTNRFLTAQLVELNEIYIAAFTQYRTAWFICLNMKTGTRVNYESIEKKIRYNLEAVEDMFYRTGNMFRGSNDNAWSFINSMKICMFLGESIEGLITINKKRNNTVIVYVLNNLQARLSIASKSISKYPDRADITK